MNEAVNALFLDDYGRRPEDVSPARPKLNVLLRLLDDYGRSVAQGATFGFGDELAAAGDATLGHLWGRGSQAGAWQERYDANLSAERARDAAIPTVISLPGQLLGGAAAMAPAASTAGVNALFNFGRGMAPLDAAVARGAAGGATTGAVYGFGSGEDGMANRLGNAGVNALFGLALGGVLPVAGAAVKQVPGYEAVRSAVSELISPAAGARPAMAPGTGIGQGTSHAPPTAYPFPTTRRPFVADYPQERWPDGIPTGEGGRLTHDIDGRPLVAPLVAGRRVLGGRDEALTEAQIDGLVERVLGSRPARSQPGELDYGVAGRIHLRANGGDTGLPATESGVTGTVRYSPTLSRDRIPLTKAHEAGHLIDYLSGALRGKLPGDAAHLTPIAFDPFAPTSEQGLLRLYDAGRSGPHAAKPGEQFLRPQDFTYPDSKAADELHAEALRAALTRPGFLKEVAPEVAVALRKYVNEHPYLSRLVQLNSLSPIAATGTAGTAAGARQDDGR